MENVKKFWDFMGKHGWSIVSLLASCGAGAWFFSLIGQIADMYLDYPIPLSAACAFAFVVGFAFCQLLGIRDRALKRYERKLEMEREAEEERRKRERRDASLKETFETMNPVVKDLVVEVAETGSRPILARDEDICAFNSFIKYKSIDGENSKLVLTEEGEDFLSRHPELVEEYKRDKDAKAAFLSSRGL